MSRRKKSRYDENINTKCNYLLFLLDIIFIENEKIKEDINPKKKQLNNFHIDYYIFGAIGSRQVALNMESHQFFELLFIFVTMLFYINYIYVQYFYKRHEIKRLD